MTDFLRSACPDCSPSLDRRTFLRAAGGAALAGAAVSLWPGVRTASAAPTARSSAETTAAELFQSLTADQKKTICFPFDHDLRKKVNANWQITKPTLGDNFYTKEQR